MGNFIFELLVIDKSGKSEISSGKKFIHGMLFSEKLWEDEKDISKEDRNIFCIEDKILKINLHVHTLDTSSALNDLIEAAFLIKVTGADFEKLEQFRYKLLFHLKNKLAFSNIRILQDDISTNIAKEIYPLINEVETSLRKYIIKFFTQKIGVDWWNITVPKEFAEKIKLRKSNETVFSDLVDTDLTLIDFDNLGEIIYKHVAGFNKQENIVEKIMAAKTFEDIEGLKRELQTNYNKFFKAAFQDFDFDKKWKELFQIRNKVAHNNLFVKSDLEKAKELHRELSEIIFSAEDKINEFRFSIEEQETILQATIDAVHETKEDSSEKSTLKIVGKIDLDEIEDDFNIITEENLLKELEKSERTLQTNKLTYVGLKAFVTKILGSKGYAFGPTYALVNILRDKGVIDIYDVDDEYSYWPVKAIRITK